MKDKITWRVKDGFIHSIPEGAMVSFHIPGLEVMMFLDGEELYHYVKKVGRVRRSKKSGKSNK